jgi:hypothetical protein
MRRARNIRYLALHETDIARTVFRNTIPYDKVVVSDGLGGGDRPFTVPTNMPVSVLFNVSKGKYVIHAGDGYYGMSYHKSDQLTLIHELTHVWQGEHSSSSWNYVFGSMWSQGLSDDAYKYDKNRLQNWADYNPEQQAQIVEDWFADGMKEKEEEDRRFYYIKKHIRGESVDHDWIAAQYEIKPLPAATLHVHPQPTTMDPLLLSILEQRVHKDDVAGALARVKRLEEFFNTLDATRARMLLTRLETRTHENDKVAQHFHHYLATATRNRLMGILRQKL